MQWGMFFKMQGTDVLPVLASPYSSPSKHSTPRLLGGLGLLGCTSASQSCSVLPSCCAMLLVGCMPGLIALLLLALPGSPAFIALNFALCCSLRHAALEEPERCDQCTFQIAVFETKSMVFRGDCAQSCPTLQALRRAAASGLGLRLHATRDLFVNWPRGQFFLLAPAPQLRCLTAPLAPSFKHGI
jgi:hypothetical protein